MVNEIVSLISLSDLLLLAKDIGTEEEKKKRHARDLCALILHVATFRNSLMSSSSFLLAYLQFSM